MTAQSHMARHVVTPYGCCEDPPGERQTISQLPSEAAVAQTFALLQKQLLFPLPENNHNKAGPTPAPTLTPSLPAAMCAVLLPMNRLGSCPGGTLRHSQSSAASRPAAAAPAPAPAAAAVLAQWLERPCEEVLLLCIAARAACTCCTSKPCSKRVS
jgi:hypothetical protein